jgi:hypothetical protein
MMATYEEERAKKNPFAIFYSAEYRKFQAVVLGVLLSAATMGLLPAAVSMWVLLVIGVLTSVGVYQVPNAAQRLVLQPAGTSPVAPDIVIETPEPKAEAMIRGDVVG